MTGEDFTARYRLKQQLADGEIASFVASDARRRPVHVHVFRGEGAPDFDIESLRPTARELVREVLDVEGLPVVVTEPLEPFSSFEAWIADHQGGGGEEEPGTYTRIFGAVTPPEEPGAEEPGAEEAEPEEPEPEEPFRDEAGEYTRIFGAPKIPEVGGSEEPGTDEAGAAEDARVPEAADPGRESEPEPAQDSPEPEPPDAPGPYTLVMGRPDVSPKKSRDEPRPRREPDVPSQDFGFSDSYLDRLKGGEAPGKPVEETGPAPPPPPPPDRPSAPRVPDGPSEYTRIIRGAGGSRGSAPGGSGVGAGSPPPAPPPEPSPPASRASKTPIVIGLVLTGAALVAIFIFFLLLPGD